MISVLGIHKNSWLRSTDSEHRSGCCVFKVQMTSVRDRRSVPVFWRFWVFTMPDLRRRGNPILTETHLTLLFEEPRTFLLSTIPRLGIPVPPASVAEEVPFQLNIRLASPGCRSNGQGS